MKIINKINGIKIGKNVRYCGMPVVYKYKKSKIEIGNNVVIKSSFLSNLIGLYQRTIIVTRCSGASIKIGDNVGMSGVTIYARKSIEIGRNTLIGGNVKIIDNDFHPLEVEARSIDDKTKIKAKPVKIGNNCFVGVNSIILKGTELGDGCVVGAGSVVSGVFPPNSVIAGNPARIIKVINNESSSN